MFDIRNLLCMTIDEVKATVLNTLEDAGIPYIQDKNYIVTKISLEPRPLICVHTDTVAILPPMLDELVNENGILRLLDSSKAECLGADDRAGIWIALMMIKFGTATEFEYGFFDLEEVGGIGSRAYGKTYPDHTCYIGLDRASRPGRNVALYGYNNDTLTRTFEDFGYKASQGSFTDCSILADYDGMGCCNMSVGYDMEHSPLETLDTAAMERTLGVMQEVIVPEGYLVAKSVPVAKGSSWNRWDNWEDRFDKEEEEFDENPKPMLCEECGTHAALYTFSSIFICADCLELYGYGNDLKLR